MIVLENWVHFIAVIYFSARGLRSFLLDTDPNGVNGWNTLLYEQMYKFKLEIEFF